MTRHKAYCIRPLWECQAKPAAVKVTAAVKLQAGQLHSALGQLTHMRDHPTQITALRAQESNHVDPVYP